MWPDDREPEAFFLRPRSRELRGEIFFAARRVFEREVFVATGDRAVAGFRKRRQPPNERRPHLAQRGSRAHQRLGIGGQLPRPRVRRFQEGISRTQRPLVGAQNRPVACFRLRSDKVQIATAHFGRAADQFEVVTGEGNHPDETQILRLVALLDAIEGHLPPERSVIKLQPVFPDMAGNNKRPLSDPHRGREARGTLRLQTQKDAGGFEQRRFPLAVRAHDEIEARGEFGGDRREAAEIAQLQFAKHEARLEADEFQPARHPRAAFLPREKTAIDWRNVAWGESDGRRDEIMIGENAVRRVHPYPARPGQVNFGPGMQRALGAARIRLRFAQISTR